jgi:hypothetical protein
MEIAGFRPQMPCREHLHDPVHRDQGVKAPEASGDTVSLDADRPLQDPSPLHTGGRPGSGGIMRWIRTSFMGLYMGLAVMGPFIGARADAILSLVPETDVAPIETVFNPPRPPSYSLSGVSFASSMNETADDTSAVRQGGKTAKAADASAEEVKSQAPVQESEKKAEVYKFPVAGYRKGTEIKTHWGLGERGGSDLFGRRGASILSVSNGQVIHAGYNQTGGYAVTVKGNDGRTYYYAHLDKAPVVRRGAEIKAGQKIGVLGDSGNAKGTGPHLHIGIGEEIRKGAGMSGGCGTNFDAVTFLQTILDGS